MNMSVEAAFRRSIETLVRWVDDEVDMKKTSVFFRSYAPIHFRFHFARIIIIFCLFCVRVFGEGVVFWIGFRNEYAVYHIVQKCFPCI